MSKIRVAVLFGGASSEHDISLKSATHIIKNIPRDKYEVVCVGITKKGRWLYYPGDVAAIASGAWEHDPDCTSTVLSPDPIHKGLITIENGAASVKKIAVLDPYCTARTARTAPSRDCWIWRSSRMSGAACWRPLPAWISRPPTPSLITTASARPSGA